MNILLLGANGQVGWQLRRSLAPLGNVTALDRRSQAFCGDLSDASGLASTVRTLRPDVIVNAAAYTAVDKAETEKDLAFRINATACAVLATEAAALGAWLVHYSTDYVFDGTGTRPWEETDTPSPLNTYGASKLAGEQPIASQAPRHLIFRTSWVFDSWGQNFLRSILRAAAARDSLSVVSDQWGAPTRAALIADVTAHAIRRVQSPDGESLAGVYHLAAAGETHWHAYATAAVQQAWACGMTLKAQAGHITPIPASQYAVAAARPANSRLNTTKLRQAFNLQLPAWQDGVEAVVAELAVHSAP